MRHVYSTANSPEARRMKIVSVLLVFALSSSMGTTLAYAEEISQETSQQPQYYSEFNQYRALGFTVEYYFDGSKDNQLTVYGQGEEGSGIPYEAFTQIGHKGSNYVLESIDGVGRIISGVVAENVVRIYYVSDNLGTDPENPDEPDLVPDKYQAVVTFSAVNGTTSITKAVVTLYNDAGYFSEAGKGTLSEAQVPSVSAASGYSQSTISWEPQAPSTSILIYSGGTHFKATFSTASGAPAAGQSTPGIPTIIPDEPVVSVAYSSFTAAFIENSASFVAEGVERVVSELVHDVSSPLPEVFFFDSSSPLSVFNAKGICWVHWVLGGGFLLMAFYTFRVLMRRRRFIEELDTFKKEVIAKPQEGLEPSEDAMLTRLRTDFIRKENVAGKENAPRKESFTRKEDVVRKKDVPRKEDAVRPLEHVGQIAFARSGGIE